MCTNLALNNRLLFYLPDLWKARSSLALEELTDLCLIICPGTIPSRLSDSILSDIVFLNCCGSKLEGRTAGRGLPLLADSTRCMPIANSSIVNCPSLSTSLRSLRKQNSDIFFTIQLFSKENFKSLGKCFFKLKILMVLTKSVQELVEVNGIVRRSSELVLL